MILFRKIVLKDVGKSIPIFRGQRYVTLEGAKLISYVIGLWHVDDNYNKAIELCSVGPTKACTTTENDIKKQLKLENE